MISGVENFNLNNKPFAEFNNTAERYYLHTQFEQEPALEKKRRKKGKALAYSIVGTSLSITALLLLFGKKSIPQKLLKIIEKQSKDFKNGLAEGNQKLQGLYEKTKSICNFSTFKDLIFLKTMYSWKPTQKLHLKITSIFEKLAKNTVNRKYIKTEKSLLNLSDNLNSALKNESKTDLSEIITINGVTQTKQKWLTTVNTMFDILKQKYVNGFGGYARDARFTDIDNIFENIDKKVIDKFLAGRQIKNINLKDLNFKDLKLKELQTFIAEDIVKADKQKLGDTIASNYKISIKEILENINQITNAIMPEKNAKKISKQSKKFNNNLNTATKKELSEYFDKIRDLKLGSGVTDVLSVLGSIAGVIIGLSVADSKETKISATLKYGIPVISSVAVSVISTVALISGMQAMMFGLATGFVVNRIGSYIDKARKNSIQENIQQILLK